MSKCEQWLEFMRLANRLPGPELPRAKLLFEQAMNDLAVVGLVIAMEPGSDTPTVPTRLNENERGLLAGKTIRNWLTAIKEYKFRTGVCLKDARDEVIAYCKACYGVERFE